MRVTFTTLSFLFALSSFGKVYTYGILGDAGAWNNNTKMVRETMEMGAISKLILPGDNIYEEELGYDVVWKHWKDFDLDIVAIGNHKVSDQAEVDYFKMPGEYFSRRVNNDIRFIILNSDNQENESEQATWFEKELADAKEQFLIVVFHHPPYTIGKHTWEERREFHEKIRPLLFRERNKIDLLIVGHDHVASLITLNEIPMIVSGASQDWHSGKPVNYIYDKKVSVKTRWLSKRGPHWPRLDLDTEEDHIWVNFVNAEKKEVVCSMRLKDSSVYMRPNCG